jgi:hypothetical protein
MHPRIDGLTQAAGMQNELLLPLGLQLWRLRAMVHP